MNFIQSKEANLFYRLSSKSNRSSFFYIFLVLLIIGINFPIIAGDFNLKVEFKKAGTFYSNKNINSALDSYLTILKNGYDNFEINYNIGCCYFKLDEVGKARYYLERALYFKPFDSDLFHNLSIIYKKILKNPALGEQVIVNRRIIFFIPINLVIILFLGFFFSTVILLVMAYLISDRRKFFFILFTSTFLLTLLLTIIFFIQYTALNERTFISTSKVANIYLTPDENETVLLSIPEGTKGIILEESADYIKVKLNDDLSGWINKDNLIAGTH
jgi:hypothetical protein